MWIQPAYIRLAGISSSLIKKLKEIMEIYREKMKIKTQNKEKVQIEAVLKCRLLYICFIKSILN